MKRSFAYLAAAVMAFAAPAACFVPIAEAEGSTMTETHEDCRLAPSSAADLPGVYRELAQNYVKALTKGYDSGLCCDDESDGDLGGGVIYDGSGEAALSRVGWATIDMGGDAPLFVAGASDPRDGSSYIYGIWATSGGKPRKLLACSYRNTITLRRRDDGALMLCTTGSQSANFFYENWREVKADDLPFVVRVVYDEVGDSERPWQIDGEPGDEDSAMEALGSIAQRCEPAALDFTPFADLAR